jgi:hypothetical protein
MAWRTPSLPRNENDRLETPPEHVRVGQLLLDLPRRLDEGEPIAVVLLDAVATAKMLGSKMMSSGGKPTFSVSSL